MAAPPSPSSQPASSASPGLLERETVLALLQQRFLAAADGTGHSVFLAGEAGVGKTSVVQAFAKACGAERAWWGACDALETPHPLAPLQDIARTAPVRFRALMGAETERAVLFGAVLEELQQDGLPTLLVVEDAHWADDATLDFLKFLGRRIDRTPCLVLVTYRDDALGANHPMRRLAGDLPSSLVTHLALPRLSAAAVDVLARRAFRSPAGVYAATHGNAFYVTELLRSGGDDVPASVHDLVLGRYGRLSPRAQDLMRLVSLVPARIERSLAGALVDLDIAVIEECLDSGLLGATGPDLSFRHELARAAVEQSLPEPVARELHRKVLRVLEAAPGEVPLARLVHHATHAGDPVAVLHHAPAAAREARRRGARRACVAHLRVAVEHARLAPSFPDAERAALLDAYARACKTTDQLEEAIAARLELREIHQRLGDREATAANLSQLALVYVPALRNEEAAEMNRQAIELLQALPAGAALASAYRVQSHLCMVDRDLEASVAWGRKAIALARKCGDDRLLASALATLGIATLLGDYAQGRVLLREAVDVASANLRYHDAANALCSLGLGASEVFRLGDARRDLSEAAEFAQKHEFDFYRNHSRSWLALVDMYLGKWDEAAEGAADVLDETSGQRSTTRIAALVALGRVRARRGDEGAGGALDEALELALASGTGQRSAPVFAARAEAAWLRGDAAAAAEAAAAVTLSPAQRHRHPGYTGEPAYWLHKTAPGSLQAEPPEGPFGLQIRGAWREAADAWSQLGCPYEAARALSEGDGTARIEALLRFEQMGARPAAEQLRRELRASGQRGIPRGMRRSTQENPHQLTAREAEVLQLLCQGMKNSEIAERLYRSVRTVDHHVAAVFSKLGVSSRAEAVSTTLRAGDAKMGSAPAQSR